MKNTFLVIFSFFSLLGSCVKDDLDTYHGVTNPDQNLENKANSDLIPPALFLNDFNIETCSKDLGTTGGGSISGGNAAGTTNIPNLGKLFYFIRNMDTGEIPRFPRRSINTETGEFEYRELPDGNYKMIAVIGTSNAFGLKRGEDVPRSESEIITVGCGDNPNINPIAQEDYSPANFELGEVRFIDLLANDFDVDGDSLQVVGATFDGIKGGGRNGLYEVVLVGNQFRITRIGGPKSGAFFRVNYTISDGKGGFDTGQLRFGAPNPTF